MEIDSKVENIGGGRGYGYGDGMSSSWLWWVKN